MSACLSNNSARLESESVWLPSISLPRSMTLGRTERLKRFRQQADLHQQMITRVPRALHKTHPSDPIHRPFLNLSDNNNNNNRKNNNIFLLDRHLHWKESRIRFLWTRRRIEARIMMTSLSALLSTSRTVRGNAKGPRKLSQSHPSSPLHLRDAMIPSSHLQGRDRLLEAYRHWYSFERLNPNMHCKISDAMPQISLT